LLKSFENRFESLGYKLIDSESFGGFHFDRSEMQTRLKVEALKSSQLKQKQNKKRTLDFKSTAGVSEGNKVERKKNVETHTQTKKWWSEKVRMEQFSLRKARRYAKRKSNGMNVPQ